ncbi:MAG: hypothetical protein ACOC2L_00875, partial [Candidatus Sumerlaeota bacterium]
FSRARVTVSRVHRPGKYRAVFYSIYLAPDNAMLKVDDARIGEFFRVVQRGERAAISLSQEGEFYIGDIDELKNASEALMGLQPTDVARAVRVGSALAEGLARLPENHSLPEPEGDGWRLGLTGEGQYLEIYSVRREDGLVKQMDLVNADLEPRIRIEYQAYADFEEKIFPSQFTIRVPEYNLKIEVEMERVRLGRVRGVSSFPLTPPPASGIEARPLSEWLMGERNAAIDNTP